MSSDPHTTRRRTERGEAARFAPLSPQKGGEGSETFAARIIWEVLARRTGKRSKHVFESREARLIVTPGVVGAMPTGDM